MKKRIMTLLMAAIMVGGVLTGCGSEKEVTEPKNDEEVVLEENAYDSETSEEIVAEETKEDETIVKDENTLFFFDMMKDAWKNGEDFVIYTTQSPVSENIVVDENTLFNAYMYEFKDLGALYKGCVVGEDGTMHDVVNLGNSLEKVEFTHEVNTYTGDNNNPYVVEIREMTYNCDIAFMDKNNDDISEYAVVEAIETYDEYGMPDEMSWTALCYFSDNAELITVNGVEYWLFTTDVSETGNTYYSVVKAPAGANDKTVKLESTDYVFENYMVNCEAEGAFFTYQDEAQGYWPKWYNGKVGIYAGFDDTTGAYHKKESSSFEADGYLLLHK